MLLASCSLSPHPPHPLPPSSLVAEIPDPAAPSTRTQLMRDLVIHGAVAGPPGSTSAFVTLWVPGRAVTGLPPALPHGSALDVCLLYIAVYTLLYTHIIEPWQGRLGAVLP